MQHEADFLIDGAPVAHASFVRVACDPRRSVVVEACAGSGKTWLLVSRMLRLLLDGAEPSELLAITFTRKAAQEMRERLLSLLEELALASPDKVIEQLTLRGLSVAEATQKLHPAQALYARVLASPLGLSIDTFHSWFARLLQIAPLASGVPHAYTLEDNTSELRDAAWLHFMQSLNHKDHRSLRDALMRVYDIAGNWNGKLLIEAFMNRRAEWWVASRSENPFEQLLALCGADGERDARLGLWDDIQMRDRFHKFSTLLGRGSPPQQDNASTIEQLMSGASSIESFDALYTIFVTKEGEAKKLPLPKALQAKLTEQEQQWFTESWHLLAQALASCRLRSQEPQVLRLNEAVFAIGAACLEHYQAIKADRRVLDFSDLEWLSWLLVTDSTHAAYLHARLDARYRHILIDEFQDTNPLQWQIVRAWLDAYGEDAHQPSVFIVGDPKQSIYRFRRAEPRVFESARALLTQRGAADLTTRQTRRNAVAIVDLLNAAMQGNRLYEQQSTTSGHAGAVWQLPLIEAGPVAQALSDSFVLRDPLTVFPVEHDDVRRQKEGHQVGLALQQARAQWQGEQPLKWSDMMILVRSRTHLTDCERGLREAGVPFVSSRRGGLLDALEVADLMALLRWLTVSADNHALAQVLKSPIISASDNDLIGLASAGEGSWWQRLMAAQPAGQLSHALERASMLLSRWLQSAAHLPVHDLLDQIMHEGELPARYATSVPSNMRNQVLGNLDAFIALALDLDAGRYPGIARFLDRLRRMQRGSEQEAPDEAAIDAALDAVRIMTIHGAKGLEAEVVVLMDANNSESGRDDLGVLCDWPQDAPSPTHFSVFGKTKERGLARQQLFAVEEAFREQENWNLLYVAATRAKQLLLVSGIHNGKDHGIAEGSWYHRLSVVNAEMKQPDYLAPAPLTPGHKFMLPLFSPPRLAPPAVRVPRDEDTEETIEGSLLHALMERLTHTNTWPVSLPNQESIAQWLRCTETLAAVIHQQAATILAQPSLKKFFDPESYTFARNEMELVHEDELLRLDRLVIIGNTVWILDYKRNFFASQMEYYRSQLQRYHTACNDLFPNHKIHMALITVDGKLWEIEAGDITKISDRVSDDDIPLQGRSA